jgi:hypothetical protein
MHAWLMIYLSIGAFLYLAVENDASIGEQLYKLEARRHPAPRTAIVVTMGIMVGAWPFFVLTFVRAIVGAAR